MRAQPIRTIDAIQISPYRFSVADRCASDCTCRAAIDKQSLRIERLEFTIVTYTQRQSGDALLRRPPRLGHAKYRADIDGLRALAVLAVVLYHAGLTSIRTGFVGVDVFFVISGFLIGGIVYQDIAHNRFSFVAFYSRRAKRILPALLAVIAMVTLLSLFLLSPGELQSFATSAVAALFGVSNVRFLHSGYFSQDAHFDPLLMTWSLGVEEQFYFFLPLALLSAQYIAPARTKAALLATVMFSLALSILLTYKLPNAAFYLLPTRAWELGFGSLLAIRQKDRGALVFGQKTEVLAVFGLAAIVISATCFSNDSSYRELPVVLATAGTLVLLASQESQVNKKLLSSRLLVSIGLISYSWYLLHWPLMAFARVCSVEAPPSTLLELLAAVSLILAYLSWRFIETPFRTISTPDLAIIRTSALAVGLCVLVLVSLQLTHGLPQRFGTHLRTLDAELLIGREHNQCIADYHETELNTSPDCLTPSNRRRIALLGDSHAGALGSALKHLAERRGFGFEEFTKSSCPSLVFATRRLPEHPGHAAECAAFNRRAISAVASDPLVRTVVIAGFWSAPFQADVPGDAYEDTRPGESARSSATELQLALLRTEALLVSKGIKVIVLGDVPRFTFDPAKEMLATFIPLRERAEQVLSPHSYYAQGVAPPITSPEEVAVSALVRKAASSIVGVTYVPLQDSLCDASGCRFRNKLVPFYADPQHLTTSGADVVLAHVRSLL